MTLTQSTFFTPNCELDESALPREDYEALSPDEKELADLADKEEAERQSAIQASLELDMGGVHEDRGH